MMLTLSMYAGGGTLTIGNLFGGDDEPVQNRRVVSNSNSECQRV